MHITFRELAQRMGLQTARAIYNEDIDICLNHAIMAKTRSIISQNAQTANDYIIKANADISQLNALRNLATKGEISGSSLTGGVELILTHIRLMLLMLMLCFILILLLAMMTKLLTIVV